MEIELQLKEVGFDPIPYMPTEGFDMVSIEAQMLVGSGFDSAVITIGKTNCVNGSPISVTTITAEGVTNVYAEDWSQFLTAQVTTKTASLSNRVLLKFNFTKNGFSTKA